MDAQYERVAAGDIVVGDRVARARTHAFTQVFEIRPGNTAVRFLDEHGHTIARPLKTAQWWRLREQIETADDTTPEAIHGARERVGRLEARIRELRAVEYPTIAQMNELKEVREQAGELNEYLERVTGGEC